MDGKEFKRPAAEGLRPNANSWFGTPGPDIEFGALDGQLYARDGYGSAMVLQLRRHFANPASLWRKGQTNRTSLEYRPLAIALEFPPDATRAKVPLLGAAPAVGTHAPQAQT
jgi:hypothetical protein